MRELILFRTHVFDDATKRFYEYLKATSNRDVLIVAEESNGALDVGHGRAKVSLNRDHVAAMGLHAPGNFGWLCGDYFVYVGLEALPSYDRYWMIEYDVRLSYDESADFFDRFNDVDADLLAFQVRKSGKNWTWHAPMSHFNPDVHACNFSLLAITRRAAVEALQKRREMSRAFETPAADGIERKWPNDESFTATTVVAAGMKLVGFNTLGQTYATPESFKEGVPLSDIRMAEHPQDGMVYHPVHTGKRFQAKVDGWIAHFRNQGVSAERAGQIFNKQLRSDLLVECGPDALKAFSGKFDSWMSEINAGQPVK